MNTSFSKITSLNLFWVILVTSLPMGLMLAGCDSDRPTVTMTSTNLKTVSIPTINPNGGTYTQPTSVTISTTTEGASIRYNQGDGTQSDPTSLSGTLYSNPILISSTTTIKAIAYKSGMTDSKIITVMFTINIPLDQVSAPTLSLPSGTYNSDQIVTLLTTTSGATIKYTIDGTDPKTSGTAVTGSSINMNQSMTIRSYAYKIGMTNSFELTAIYTLQVVTPTFNPNGGTYTSNQTVSLSTTTTGVTIKYTIDNTDPKTSGTAVVGNSVNVGSSQTIRVYAYRTGWTSSEEGSTTYTLLLNSPTGVSATDGTYTNKVTIMWNAVTSATDYRIYRGTTSGSYTLLFGTTGGLLTIDDTSAVSQTRYYYVIQAYNPSIGWSCNSIENAGYAGPISFATTWGTNGAGNGQFNQPLGIAVDNNGNVYVADKTNNRIQKFTTSGSYLTQWGSSGSGSGQFNQPWGIAVDSSGNMYIADSGNHRIQKFSSSGSFILQWGSNGTTNGKFSFPRGIAVDSSGNVYVADSSNHRIQKFNSSGTYLTQWGGSGTGIGKFNQPWGVAVDNSGNVYVADTYNYRIQKFTSTGSYVTKWGVSGAGNSQFNYPSGVAVSSSGDVYVVDTYNYRIQKFNSTGSYFSQWGSNGTGNGQFNLPRYVALDSSGNVYMADTGNNRIQVFAP